MANKTFNDLLQDFVNKSFEELVELANDALKAIFTAMQKLSLENEPSEYILPFIASTLAVDGKYTQLEHKFLNSVLESDISYETAKEYMQAHYNDEIFDLVDQMIDACGDDLKNSFVIFCLCFAAVDETITREEGAYIAKLLS